MDMIPTGFRFCPSDKVLLSYYLLKKLKGESTQFQIPDVDVYNIEPWSLFNDINDEDDDDDEATYNNLTYVFTTIKKKHGSESERISRTVTTPSSKNQVVGTWRDQKAQDIIDMVSNKIIGSKRMLSFIPAPISKQDHDDEDNEGTSNKRKRNHLDGISYIMHEYSMAGSSHVLCRIRRKISKSRKKNNKKMKYSSSCSTNITRENTCWDDQAGAEYNQPLHGSRMPYEDDHHQMMTNTSVPHNHNQSSMLQQQQQQDQDVEYNYQQVQECMPQMMMNTSVVPDHDLNSMWQQQLPEQVTEFNYQPIQECISQVMMDTSIVDHDQSSMWQQQQPDQDAEADQLLQGRIPYDDHHQIMVDTSVLDHEINDQNSMWQQQQQPVQSKAEVTGGPPILTNDEEIEEEDLSNQQQQPPAPTSEQEENLYLLSSIDFQPDDASDFGNFYIPERFDDPLDTISLWSY